MNTEVHQLVKNDFLIDYVEGTFEVKEGNHTSRGEASVEFYETVVCTSLEGNQTDWKRVYPVGDA